MKTYKNLREKIGRISAKILDKSGLKKYIDIEFFDHFFILGILFHSVLLFFLNPEIVVLLAFVIGIGKEIFDKYIVQSAFSVRGSLLTIFGGVIPPISYLILKDFPPDVVLAILVLIVSFLVLALMIKKHSSRRI